MEINIFVPKLFQSGFSWNFNKILRSEVCLTKFIQSRNNEDRIFIFTSFKQSETGFSIRNSNIHHQTMNSAHSKMSRILHISSAGNYPSNLISFAVNNIHEPRFLCKLWILKVLNIYYIFYKDCYTVNETNLDLVSATLSVYSMKTQKYFEYESAA